MESSSESKKMSTTVREAISIVAGPRGWMDTRESWLALVPRRVRTVTFRTVKALWYGEISDPDHWAARDIKREAEAILMHRERNSAAHKFQTLAGTLDEKDSKFYQSEVAALLSLARRISGSDSPGEEGSVT